MLDTDASNGNGTNTYVELEFPEPVTLAGFRHVDRNDPATVAESELVFLNDGSNAVARVAVTHVNERGGATFITFPQVTAKKSALAGNEGWWRLGYCWRRGTGLFYTGPPRGAAN